MHVDRVGNMFCDSYIVEFAYDPTCNYYEKGKYARRNFHVSKLPLFMLRLLPFTHQIYSFCISGVDEYFPPNFPAINMELGTCSAQMLFFGRWTFGRS